MSAFAFEAEGAKLAETIFDRVSTKDGGRPRVELHLDREGLGVFLSMAFQLGRETAPPTPDRFSPDDEALVRKALIAYSREQGVSFDTRQRAYAIYQVLRMEVNQPQEKS